LFLGIISQFIRERCSFAALSVAKTSGLFLQHSWQIAGIVYLSEKYVGVTMKKAGKSGGKSFSEVLFQKICISTGSRFIQIRISYTASTNEP
jgi:hypothetical protein